MDNYYSLERDIAGKEPAVAPEDICNTDLATEAQEAVAGFKP